MSETRVNMGQPNGYASQNLSWIQYNVDYFKSRDGKLKIAQMFVAIICMALTSPAYKGSVHFFNFVVVINFICTFIWLFFHFLGVKDALTMPINWKLSECSYCIIATMMYAAAFIIQMATFIGNEERYAGRNITAGFFGLVNTLLYAAAAYFLYLQHKFGDP